MRVRPHILVSADAVGGVWQYTLDLAEGLGHRGVAVTIALMGPIPAAEGIAQAEAKSGARIVATGLPLDWTADTAAEVSEASQALAALAREIGADLVHLHSPALAIAAFDGPLVAVCHSCVATWWAAVGRGRLPDDLAWRRDLVAHGCRNADRLIAPTEAFALATQSVYGLRQPPIVVRNGRSTVGQPTGATPMPYAFTAGRLWDCAKNAAALDRMAARLDCPVLAAGQTLGPSGVQVNLTHLHGLGRLDDAGIAEQLARRPVFVSLARYEPFGLAVLEAAAAGCALVLSDIGSFRELWDGAAVFVAPDDDAAAADAIRRLVDEPDHRAALGEAAHARAACYSVEAMVEGVLGVFQSLLSRSVLGEAAA